METGEPRPLRREQIALALVAGVTLLVVGRLWMRRPAGEVSLLPPSPTPAALLVHVVGEVVVPGIYRLPPGARWSDALQAARGPTFLADLKAVNLAQPLRDGERVLIPRVPEPVLPEGAEGVDAGATAGAAAPPPGPLDPNTASAAELEALPGIGPVLARRIVEHRRAHGRFERLEDLLEVEGIGPRMLERLRPLLRLR
ncbi:MAG: helix-hairpin-helix domain-containing protein [Armatimonadota bacterium]|nr:helix-hairpin-helix domain-containing protein [Armatimonadota bacterium]MDR7470471.1 helix-hairpin-helix domain-containing protein [Armatimonadota bacterium]MDR7473551.1 helix-hairpin-helix domain-containing protein [Armatimonadota bacterium]MDR7539970.1 helix-hairpin-helix domain-containing protein [Armatimonadota bacterium]